MSNITRTNPRAVRYATDPFAFARDLLSWDVFPARTESAFVPSFEVKETADAFVVKADLPGVKETDVDVSVHQGVLSISGHRQSEERKEGESYSLLERQFGSFTRSFSLPDTADGDKIEAALEHGVLTLRIAKKEQAQPRKIALGKRS